jgi:cell division protein FtsL
MVLASLLALVVLGSAVSVVHIKHRSRILFVELQGLERQRDELNVEWTQLALERSSWATHDRIEDLATARLGFQVPSPQQMEVVAAP